MSGARIDLFQFLEDEVQLDKFLFHIDRDPEGLIRLPGFERDCQMMTAAAPFPRVFDQDKAHVFGDHGEKVHSVSPGHRFVAE